MSEPRSTIQPKGGLERVSNKIMKNFMKGKFGTIVILLFTVILAGVAIFTALRLYQLRSQPVAPNVPSSIPRAAENASCSLSFTLTPGRQGVCKSASISSTNPARGENITIGSSVKDGMTANSFTYAVYNVDNPYSANNPKPVCVTSGGDSTYQGDCKAGTHTLIFTDLTDGAPNAVTRSTGTRIIEYAKLFVTDENNNKPLVHAQINAYFQLGSNPVSLPDPNCVVFTNAAGAETLTPTPTPTATPTASPSPTGAPNSCGGTCGSNANCNGGLYCNTSVGLCRNASCPSQANCTCSGTSAPTPTPTAPTPTPTAPALPKSGTDWPTVVGAGVGVFVIIGSLLLAL